jgi:hypothetical protein
VLHEGPVPEGLSLEDLSRVRAEFIAACGWERLEKAMALFAERDRTLSAQGPEEDVVLWLEHDLYDQLQLLQILDWFAGHPERAGRLFLICIDRFEGIEPFYGLGQLSPKQLSSLWSRREPVTPEQLALAQKAWHAFRAPEPGPWAALLCEETAALPFLKAAVLRHLQQFPSVENGLSHTERQLLSALSDTPMTFANLFKATQAAEESPFMGDTVLRQLLQQLVQCRVPLAHLSATGLYILTQAGRAVLQGQQNHVQLNGIDRWLGGVHLKKPRQRLPLG